MKVPKYFKVLISTTHVKLEPIFNEDVVEVVRCIDCTWNDDWGRCTWLCKNDYGDPFYPDKDFYCKFGERKETE